jgi:hypothetical protein
VIKVIRKILKKTSTLKEYLGIRKIIYEDDVITILNYYDLVSIKKDLIVIKDLLIKGEELRVIYQDPVKIKIKGKIAEVIKNDK